MVFTDCNRVSFWLHDITGQLVDWRRGSRDLYAARGWRRLADGDAQKNIKIKLDIPPNTGSSDWFIG